MPERMPKATREREQRAAPHILLAAAAALYACGVAIQAIWVVFAPFGIGLRLVAIALFAWYAVRRRSLTLWIFWGMAAGIELGLDAPAAAIHARVLSDMFLRLIKTIVAPLILGTLITGIAGHGELKSVGRLGLKSLAWFEVLTTLALIVGLVAINVTRAGVGLAMPVHAVQAQSTGGQAAAPASSGNMTNQAAPPASGSATPGSAVAGTTSGRTAATFSIAGVTSGSGTLAPGAPPESPLSWDQFLVHVVPENLAKSIAENQILQVAVFAVLFGLALGRLSEEKRAPMMRLAESLTEAMFAFTNLVMYMAPVAVGSALAYTVAHSGVGVMLNLGKLLGTLYAALLVFAVVVLLPLVLLARIPLRGFLQAIAEPATIAFATATSEAALPRAMESMEAFGVPRKIVAFVIPTGYSFNLTGSALYLALASVFVAQAAGMHMSWTAQAFMMLTLMLTSKGVAGVPRAGLVVLMATAATFHLPEEPIFVILGIDALMDMGRTTVNVVGNCLTSVLVARWEGEFRVETPSELAVAALED